MLEPTEINWTFFLLYPQWGVGVYLNLVFLWNEKVQNGMYFSCEKVSEVMHTLGLQCAEFVQCINEMGCMVFLRIFFSILTS